MGLFGHKCSKCGAECKWETDGLIEGWWCPECHKRKKQARRIEELEERLRRLEARS